MSHKFFLLALLALLLFSCPASADLAYTENGQLYYVYPDGTKEFTGISCDAVFSFGDDLLLITHGTSIAVYSLQDFTAPKAEGDISASGLKVSGTAFSGGKLILSGRSIGGTIIELDPETCAVTDAYTHFTDTQDEYESEVFAWNGIIVVSFTGESGEVITMDSFGNVTGWIEASPAVTVSGGNLYFALEGLKELGGIYCLSGTYENINLMNAGRIAEDIPEFMCSDGSEGIYYTLGGSVMHWDGTEISCVYTGSELPVTGRTAYDASAGMLYAETDEGLAVLIAGEGGMFGVSGVYPAGSWTAAGSRSIQEFSGIIQPAIISDDVLERLAGLEGIASSDIHMLTEENISGPQELTPAMTSVMRSEGYTALCSLGTVTVSEDGFYAMSVRIPEEFAGMDMSRVKLYALPLHEAETSAFTASASGGARMTDNDGNDAEEVAETMIIMAMLESGNPVCMVIAGVFLLSEGGDDSGGSCGGGGIGLAAAALWLIAGAAKQE